MNIQLKRNLKTDNYGFLSMKEVYEVPDNSFDDFIKKGWAVVTQKPATVGFYEIKAGGIARQIKLIEQKVSKLTVKYSALSQNNEKREDVKKRLNEEFQPKIDKLAAELVRLNEKAEPEKPITVSEKKMKRGRKIAGKE